VFDNRQMIVRWSCVLFVFRVVLVRVSGAWSSFVRCCQQVRTSCDHSKHRVGPD